MTATLKVHLVQYAILILDSALVVQELEVEHAVSVHLGSSISLLMDALLVNVLNFHLRRRATVLVCVLAQMVWEV